MESKSPKLLFSLTSNTTSTNDIHEKEQKNNSEDEVLNALESQFYLQDFEPIPYLWHNLPENLTEEYINQNQIDRERALDVINDQLSNKVMSSYDSFVQAMNRIQQLGWSLRESTQICRESRSSLKTSKDQLAVGNLKVVALYKRRQIYKAIISQLLEIKKICET